MTVNVPRWRMAALFPVAVMLFLSSCGDDTPGSLQPDPADADYHVYLYYDVDSMLKYMPVISSKTTEVVDTVPLSVFPNSPRDIEDLRFTSDGRYEIVIEYLQRSSSIVCVDRSTGDTLGRVPTRHRRIVLATDNQMVVAFGDHKSGIGLYSLPSLSQIWTSSDTNIMSVDFFANDEKMVYTLHGDSLFIVDLTQQTPLVTRLQHPAYNLPHFPQHIVSDRQDGVLYSVGALDKEHSSLDYLMVLDQSDLSIKGRVELPNNYALLRPVVSESGQLVILYYWEGSPWPEQPPITEEALPGVVVYDNKTESLRRFVSHFDDVGYFINPIDLAISPDDRTLAMLTSINPISSGILLFLDMTSGEITGSVRQGNAAEARMIRFDPIPKRGEAQL